MHVWDWSRFGPLIMTKSAPLLKVCTVDYILNIYYFELWLQMLAYHGIGLGNLAICYCCVIRLDFRFLDSIDSFIS